MAQLLDLTQPKNMLALQGDRVVVYKHEGKALVMEHVLTLVRVIDFDRQEMRMVNRESKTRLPDWPFTQQGYEHLRPAAENKFNAQWELTLKAK